MTVQQAPPQTGFQTFEVHPRLLEEGKTSTRLVKTDLISAGVQVIAAGGETNLHAHAGEDAIWLVLDGRARFYSVGDEVVAELDRYEAIVIPREAPYWFESASDDKNLVIMRFGARAQNEEQRRIDYGTRIYAVGDSSDGIKREVKYRGDEVFGV